MAKVVEWVKKFKKAAVGEKGVTRKTSLECKNPNTVRKKVVWGRNWVWVGPFGVSDGAN